MSGSRLSPLGINSFAPSGAELSRWFATGNPVQQARAAYWAERRPRARAALRSVRWAFDHLYDDSVIVELVSALHTPTNPDADPEGWFLTRLAAVEAAEAFSQSPCGIWPAWQESRGDLGFELLRNRPLRRRLIPLARAARAATTHGEWVVEFLDLFEER